jgi:hypothetical protein
LRKKRKRMQLNTKTRSIRLLSGGVKEIVDCKDTDLHIDRPVYAIHLTEVKEVD